MFKHLWVERSYVIWPNEPILNSMLAFWRSAGYVCWRSWRRRAREVKRRRLEATSNAQAGNSSRFVAIEFLSQITNTRMRIKNVRTYIHIIYKI